MKNNDINNENMSPSDENEEMDSNWLIGSIGESLVSKPFGILWYDENMEEFLKKLGYKIITRKDPETDREYNIAVKPNDPSISDEGYSNVRDVFDNEVQKILLGWLLKISKN